MKSFEEKKKFIDNFFLFLIELNLNRSTEEVLSDLEKKKDKTVINRNLKFIKKLNLKSKAQLKKSKFKQAQKLFRNLKKEQGDKLFEAIKNTLGEEKRLQFDALYRKFQGLTEDDMNAMLEDEKIIELMKEIDKKSDTSNDNN